MHDPHTPLPQERRQPLCHDRALHGVLVEVADHRSFNATCINGAFISFTCSFHRIQSLFFGDISRYIRPRYVPVISFAPSEPFWGFDSQSTKMLLAPCMGNGHPTFNRESLFWGYKPLLLGSAHDHPLAHGTNPEWLKCRFLLKENYTRWIGYPMVVQKACLKKQKASHTRTRTRQEKPFVQCNQLQIKPQKSASRNFLQGCISFKAHVRLHIWSPFLWDKTMCWWTKTYVAQLFHIDPCCRLGMAYPTPPSVSHQPQVGEFLEDGTLVSKGLREFICNFFN